MWRKALGADGKRIIDIRVMENHGEVAKYVAKPGGYLELTGGQWQCDDRVLETLHYGLPGLGRCRRCERRWVSSIPRIRVRIWSMSETTTVLSGKS